MDDFITHCAPGGISGELSGGEYGHDSLEDFIDEIRKNQNSTIGCLTIIMTTRSLKNDLPCAGCRLCRYYKTGRREEQQ